MFNAIASANRTRGRVRVLLASCVLLGSFHASEASATPEYPLVIDTNYGTQCPNPNSRCVICHTSSRGGQATAVRPFAQTLRQYGLNRGRDSAALLAALAALPGTTDSDDDGTPDEQELMMCGNPSGDELGLGPEYGCDGAHLTRHVPSDAPLGVISLLIAGLIVRRRRAIRPERC